MVRVSYLCFYLLLLIFVVIVKTRVEERFSNDFDKVLDNKCKLLTSNRLNNYLGPWDNRSGDCGEYSCPSESCSFLRIDPGVSQQYGLANYKWETETLPQTMTEVNGEIQCTSRHGTTHPTHNTSIDCQSIRTNDADHGQTDVCYEYKLDESDPDKKKWMRTTYKKLMDEYGHYQWKSKDHLGGRIKTDQEMSECRKEPFDCSQSNYYCCEIYGVENSCYNRPITASDQLIEFVINEFETYPEKQGLTCRPTSQCGVFNCLEGDEFVKNCWMFNRENRSWTNNVFRRKLIHIGENDECPYVDDNDVRFQERFYTEGICQSNEPLYTNETCARDNEPVTCEFMDHNEQMYSKTYQSRLHYNQSECIYETKTESDILVSGLYRSPGDSVNTDYLQSVGYPGYLTEDELCPILTPNSCRDPEHFLKIYHEDQAASPECMACPEGTFRNTSNYVWTASEACTSIAVCPTISECERDTPSECRKCLKRLSDGNGDKFEEVFLELQPNRDQCEVVDDSACETNEDGNYLECPKELEVIGDKIYCDNCNKGYELGVVDGTVQCRKIIDCGIPVEKTCLDQNGLHFDYYIYENDTDKFSPCVWKQLDNQGSLIPNCVTECEQGEFRVTSHTGSGEEYCSRAINSNF